MSILNNEDQSKDGSSDKEKESNKDRLERLLAYWAGSEENKKILLITANPATGGVSKSSYKEKSAFITQFGYLAGRASKNAFRNPFIVNLIFKVCYNNNFLYSSDPNSLNMSLFL